MYRLLFLVFIIFSGQVKGNDELIQSSVKTSYMVQESPKIKLYQHGSGTVIKKDDNGFYVLSCYHIAEHGGKVGETGKMTVLTHDGTVYDASVIAYDYKRELSLLRVLTKKAKVRAAILAKKEDYKTGMEIIKCGYPGGEKRVILEGKCADYSTINSRGTIDSVSIVKAEGGDSGGGLFRKKDNKFIGVIWGGNPEGKTWCSSLKEIRFFLKKNKVLDAEDKNP